MGGDSDKYMYIHDKEYSWYPVKLIKIEGSKAHVEYPLYPNEESILCDGGKGAKKSETKIISLKDYPNGVLPMQNVDSKGQAQVFADMVQLPFLHEAAILYNLKYRHKDGHPYTRTGDIIVAINPFKWFDDLYTEEKRNHYSNKLVWQNNDSDVRATLAPHVYETSALCFKGLSFGQQDQSILVSGESGAGKTETVKICMNHIASVQRGPSSTGGIGTDPVVDRVLMSNPLLEAFGNAKTLRNDNSSRFGKYAQLQFDNRDAKMAGELNDRSKSYCTLAGSKCEVYLLEKNRVTAHEKGERTFHIFYQLISSSSSTSKYWDGLNNASLDTFKYIGANDTKTIEGKSDADHFKTVVDTLKLIDVNDENIKLMMRAICAVMQCGNLTFGALNGDSDKSTCTSPEEMNKLASLLGVSADSVSLAFTERTMKTRTETYKVPLNQQNAKDSADSFAKEVYGKVFLWLVSQINIATCAEDNYKNGSLADYNFGIIGLLDIFGFESFAINRFEQLCINYANEKLQQKFTEDIFQSVQEEYEQEGIELAEIKYDDNSDVLDLIENRTGLCALLNEECVRPKGTAEGFVNKAVQMNKRSKCLFENKMDNRLSFGIHHYAGKVYYTCDNFVARNQDSLPTDLMDCAQKSTNFIISQDPEASRPKKDETVGASGGKRATPKRQKSNIVAPTVWTKYRSQLLTLMTDLRKTKSKYIRCIKPNMAKKPVLMEHVATVEQLRCAGVIAAITLSRSAFPNRVENPIVIYRYSSMWDKKKYPSTKSSSDVEEEKRRKDIDALLTCALKEREEDGKKAFVVGRTRTYFRAGALEYLETNRAAGMDGQAIVIQAIVRGFLIYKKFGNIKGKREAEERKKREEEERKKKEAEEAKRKAEEEAKKKAAAEALRKKKEKEMREREKKEKKRKLEELKKAKEEKALRDAEEREAQKEIERMEKIIDDLKKELDKKNAKNKEEIDKAIKEAEEEEAKMKELEAKYEATLAEASKLPKKELAEAKKKAEDSNKIVQYLKKENARLRSETEQMEADLEKMKETNTRLVEANASAGASLESLNKQAKLLDDNNKKLEIGIEKYKKENKKLEHDLEGRQAYVQAETEVRSDYEKAMDSIVKMMEEECNDPDLVEKVMTVQLKCVTSIARGN